MAGWFTIMSSITIKPLLKPFIGWIFAHMSFALPVQRLKETKNLIAFYHPRPAYPVHILLVPKKSISSLEELSAEDSDFLLDLFQCVQSLVNELGLVKAGYRLVVNGGNYQDFPQLHFHLISD
jgi:histidine triad (HIT) family protein